MNAAEGARGAGGVGAGGGVLVGEGSPMLSLKIARHRACVAVKVHGGAVIIAYCKKMACSGITYLLKKTNIATSPRFIFPIYH